MSDRVAGSIQLGPPAVKRHPLVGLHVSFTGKGSDDKERTWQGQIIDVYWHESRLYCVVLFDDPTHFNVFRIEQLKPLEVPKL